MVNSAFAARLGGLAKVVGTTVVIQDVPRLLTGVVGDPRDIGIRRVEPAVYLPFAWQTAPRIAVRGNAEGARKLANAIMARDPSLLATIKPYDACVDDAISTTTFAASIAGALGMLALAAIGMFGVFSYWVQQRQHDIGVRLALGATRGNVVRLVLGASTRAVMWGLAIGLVAAVGAAQLLRNALYGMSPTDPVAFTLATGVLLGVAVVATLVPTWRAVRVSPMEALRAD